jgi:hypothetical protein
MSLEAPNFFGSDNVPKSRRLIVTARQNCSTILSIGNREDVSRVSQLYQQSGPRIRTGRCD